MNLVKKGLKFEEIKQYLRQIPSHEIHWGMSEETLYELMYGLQSYSYINLDYEKVQQLYNKMTGYILWESTCTDTQVGQFLYEYEGELTFSTVQYYRKGDTHLTIHNKEKSEKLRQELLKCLEEDEYSTEVEEFTTDRIIWAVDYVQSAIRRVLFLDDDEIMREITAVNRRGHSIFEATITYLDAEGYSREFTGNCNYRIIDSIFSDGEMIKRFKDRHVNDFLVEPDNLTTQTG